jgi:predicted nucleic acid-binding protein
MTFLFDTFVYLRILLDARFARQAEPALRRIAPRLYLSSVVRAELTQGARGPEGRSLVDRLLWNGVSRQSDLIRRRRSSTQASAFSRHGRGGLSAFRSREATTIPRLALERSTSAGDSWSPLKLSALASSTTSKHVCPRVERGNHPSIWASYGQCFFRYSEGA